MKKFLFLSLAISLFAAQVQITSKRFEGDQNKRISKFIGNVVVTKQKDRLTADEVIVYFDTNKKPQKIVATGNVRFTLYDKNQKYYKGVSDQVTYFPKKKYYIFTGHVHITQYPDNKQIFGEKMRLDLVNSSVDVVGSGKKPVKMIFDIEE